MQLVDDEVGEARRPASRRRCQANCVGSTTSDSPCTPSGCERLTGSGSGRRRRCGSRSGRRRRRRGTRRRPHAALALDARQRMIPRAGAAGDVHHDVLRARRPHAERHAVGAEQSRRAAAATPTGARASSCSSSSITGGSVMRPPARSRPAAPGPPGGCSRNQRKSRPLSVSRYGSVADRRERAGRSTAPSATSRRTRAGRAPRTARAARGCSRRGSPRRCQRRRKASTRRFAGASGSNVPRPNALVPPPQPDDRAHPVQQRRHRALLRLDVHRLVAVRRIDDHREVERRAVARSEKPALRSALHCIGVRTPLRSPR